MSLCNADAPKYTHLGLGVRARVAEGGLPVLLNWTINAFGFALSKSTNGYNFGLSG